MFVVLGFYIWSCLWNSLINKLRDLVFYSYSGSLSICLDIQNFGSVMDELSIFGHCTSYWLTLLPCFRLTLVALLLKLYLMQWFILFMWFLKVIPNYLRLAFLFRNVYLSIWTIKLLFIVCYWVSWWCLYSRLIRNEIQVAKSGKARKGEMSWE